jgi:hypothetical protein
VFSPSYARETGVDVDAWLELHEHGDAAQGFASVESFADNGVVVSESEGGAIPIEAIVANVAGESIPLVGDEGAVADWTPKPTDAEQLTATKGPAIAGELARAVAFETLEGEAAPIVYAASPGSGGPAVPGPHLAMLTGYPALVASNERTQVAANRELRGQVGESAIQALGRKDRLDIEPGSSIWHLARADWSGADVDPVDEAFATAFSLLDANEEPEQEKATRSRLWLAAMPVLAVLTAERIASIRKKSSSSFEDLASRP